MLKLKVKILGMDRALNGVEKQVRYATAVALTRTVKVIKDAMPAALDRSLDRPTQFTKGGLYVKAANPSNLTAEVGFKDRQASYMRYQIDGGARTPGHRGIKLPGNIVLNPFGNIPRGMIDKLKAAAQSGQLSKAIGRKLGVGNRRKGAAPIQLFFGKPTGRRWENAPLGIWWRIPGKPGKLIPVILFASKPAQYKPRFNFEAEAGKVVQVEWATQFDAALTEAMRTAR